MSLGESVLDAIGNTPLVRLKRISRGLKPWIYAKLEFMNPGGSVKDRIASYLVADAEKEHLLKKGGTIIEPTSGNTGVGLAMLAAVRGYKVIFTMPDKVSEEKRALLRAYGAKLVVAPTELPPSSPRHYVNVARRMQKETPNSFMPNQYQSLANPKAHYETTGPEIWHQTDGQIDAFVAGVGTGGTISGAGRYLKQRKKSLLVVGVEPEGSIYGNLKHGTNDPLHPYLVEGVGEDFVPGSYDPSVVDEIITVSDARSIATARKLATEEGILAGGSSGTAVAGALELAKRKPRLKLIVVLLPDSGRSYLSKIYNPVWLKKHGLSQG
ncbi:MAG TPA: cysteine synthase family protein [Nitrososphaerales archaeon]|nr:cysteine synthase family protein [Nitrososphaerales archaeon]